MYDVNSKVVLVTGGASGIGAEIVKGFLDKGSKLVAFFDVAEETGKAFENELASKYGSSKVKFYKCDVTNSDELNKSYDDLLKTQKYIDVLVNNAGILNDKLFKQAVAINVTAVIENSLKAYSLMRKDRGGEGGTIINIASVAALANHPFLPVYNATKAAVLKFSLSLGNQFHYSRSGVRVLTVCFGATTSAIFNDYQYKVIDEECEGAIRSNAHFDKFQSAKSAAIGLLEAFENGETASTWLISNNLPAEDITGDVTEGYKAMCTSDLTRLSVD